MLTILSISLNESTYVAQREIPSIKLPTIFSELSQGQNSFAMYFSDLFPQIPISKVLVRLNYLLLAWLNEKNKSQATWVDQSLAVYCQTCFLGVKFYCFSIYYSISYLSCEIVDSLSLSTQLSDCNLFSNSFFSQLSSSIICVAFSSASSVILVIFLQKQLALSLISCIYTLLRLLLLGSISQRFQCLFLAIGDTINNYFQIEFFVYHLGFVYQVLFCN